MLRMIGAAVLGGLLVGLVWWWSAERTPDHSTSIAHPAPTPASREILSTTRAQVSPVVATSDAGTGDADGDRRAAEPASRGRTRGVVRAVGGLDGITGILKSLGIDPGEFNDLATDPVRREDFQKAALKFAHDADDARNKATRAMSSLEVAWFKAHQDRFDHVSFDGTSGSTASARRSGRDTATMCNSEGTFTIDRDLIDDPQYQQLRTDRADALRRLAADFRAELSRIRAQ